MNGFIAVIVFILGLSVICNSVGDIIRTSRIDDLEANIKILTTKGGK